MTTADLVQYMGYLVGSFALGYVHGFGVLSIKKFFEQV